MKHRKTIEVKVTVETGESWITEINGTLETARRYFLGNKFNVGVYPTENIHQAMKVEAA